MDLLRFTVSEFNQILTDIIHNQLQLNRLSIQGEITQFNQYHNHLYLTLSHKNSHLNCVVYNAAGKKLPYIKKGDKCDVIGQCNYLKNKGQLIFSAVTIIKLGDGLKVNNQIEKIKTYEKKGLLNLKDNDQIPQIIEKVCLVTSAESAAFFDIESIFSKYKHPFETILIPSSVQGLNAEKEIINALKVADSLNPDVICLSRGGGSENDFDCFFSDSIAQQICNLNTPLICGIGHKINTTLSCLLANNHFETPSAMATWLCHYSMEPLNHLTNRLKSFIPAMRITLESSKNHLNTLESNLKDALSSNLLTTQKELENLNFKLSQLNPLKR